MQNDNLPPMTGTKPSSIADVVSTVTSLGEESISQECLIDMFASFDNECRRTILIGLEKSFRATNLELSECKDPETQAVLSKSLSNLDIMQQCCKKAQSEFDDLDKDTSTQ